MPSANRTLLRYSQIRRLGSADAGGGADTDAPFSEGRSFEATCLATDEVYNCVYITGSSGTVPSVTKVNPSNPATMPAIGLIVAKPTPTTCLVQVQGVVYPPYPVTPGAWYYVGASGHPSTTAPASPGLTQAMGVGIDTTRWLLAPGYKTNVYEQPQTVIEGEVPTGAVNGSNVTFSTALPFAAGTTRLHLNGLRLVPGVGADYTEGPGSQTLTLGSAPRAGDHLLVDYLT